MPHAALYIWTDVKALIVLPRRSALKRGEEEEEEAAVSFEAWTDRALCGLLSVYQGRPRRRRTEGAFIRPGETNANTPPASHLRRTQTRRVPRGESQASHLRKDRKKKQDCAAH